MKNINFTALFLAFLVILMFCLVGVALSYTNFWLASLFTLLGFFLMGFGLYMKRKQRI